MADDTAIRAEIIAAIPTEHHEKCIPEIDDLILRTNHMDGKSCLQKVYAQWKSGRTGKDNKLNSWTGFYLGITTKEPSEPFVFKKRRAFARPEPPDIDSDFEYEKRPMVMGHIVDKYGRNCVGNIGTMGALKLKSALTRIIKGLDIANAFRPNDPKAAAAFTTENAIKVKEILDSLPPQRGAILKVKGDDGKEHTIKTIADANRWCKDFSFYMKRYPEILEHSDSIEGLLSIFGVHASGVVISDVPLEEIAPLRTSPGDKDVLATQWANEDIAELGLIKFDVLAISTLSVVSRAVKLIEENCGFKVDIENIPLDDKPTIDLYRRGDLVGVFQCESVKMQQTCKDISVDRFEDVMAAISLFRPGPMDSIPEYCARKKGEKPVTYFHPTIEPHVKKYLAKTYGVLVYQEQVMQICSALAGFTIGEGYVVIKGISKKKQDVIDKFKPEFIKGCAAKGVPEKVAEEYWDKFITPFASYGFNAAHSCCYAYNSFLTAYLKANFPEEFMVASLNVCAQDRYFERPSPGKPPGCKELENECAKMGMLILPRDINKCDLDYTIVRKKDKAGGVPKSEIRPSINCKGLPHRAAENIVAVRPFNSVREFAEKTDTACVDADAAGSLCDAKFFRTNKEKFLTEFKIVREDLKELKKKGRVSDNIFE